MKIHEKSWINKILEQKMVIFELKFIKNDCMMTSVELNLLFVRAIFDEKYDWAFSILL